MVISVYVSILWGKELPLDRACPLSNTISDHILLSVVSTPVNGIPASLSQQMPGLDDIIEEIVKMSNSVESSEDVVARIDYFKPTDHFGITAVLRFVDNGMAYYLTDWAKNHMQDGESLSGGLTHLCRSAVCHAKNDEKMVMTRPWQMVISEHANVPWEKELLPCRTCFLLITIVNHILLSVVGTPVSGIQIFSISRRQGLMTSSR